MKSNTILVWIILLTAMLGLSGCMTYYQRQADFQRHFQTGRMEDAARVLENDRKAERRRTRLLHMLDQGVVHHLLQDYAQSNAFFEEAYMLVEDHQTNYMDEALAIVSNPKMTVYRGEEFEWLMIHYYKAMNFIQLGDLDAALVECRRMNIRMDALNDKFRSDNRYSRDAFIHNLMGIIYDASGDYNNAFIAYRNAYNIYEEDYSRLFGVGPPEQLKHDLLRAARRTGFRDQFDYYAQKFDISPEPQPGEGMGELVFFWQNGLGPVKQEWSINFAVVKGAGGQMVFQNEEMGLSFPFASAGNASGDIGDLRVVRVAFPKFTERKPVYAGARLRGEGVSAKLDKAQDINAIAFKSLEDRMIREMGQALLRLAVKQAAEQSLRKENEGLGALLGLLGAATEQADTRNWQTLPHTIGYTRVQLPEGRHQLSLELLLPSNNVGRTLSLEANIRPGRTTFTQMHTLDARPPGVR
jgi:uncharacterized protein